MIERSGIIVGCATSSTDKSVEHQLITARAAFGARNAKAGRGIALRIGIDDQHAFADRGHGGCKIDGGGRFADAAFLIDDRDHPAVGLRYLLCLSGFSCCGMFCIADLS